MTDMKTALRLTWVIFRLEIQWHAPYFLANKDPTKIQLKKVKEDETNNPLRLLFEWTERPREISRCAVERRNE